MAPFIARSDGSRITYHEEEIKYEEQVLDHAHSASHFRSSVLRFGGRDVKTIVLSEENEDAGTDTHVTHNYTLDVLESNCPTPTEILFKRRFARRQCDGGARVRPKLAEDTVSW